jgi:hypothetical protein
MSLRQRESSQASCFIHAGQLIVNPSRVERVMISNAADHKIKILVAAGRRMRCVALSVRLAVVQEVENILVCIEQ